jgi:hypothetical protein
MKDVDNIKMALRTSVPLIGHYQHNDSRAVHAVRKFKDEATKLYSRLLYVV